MARDSQRARPPTEGTILRVDKQAGRWEAVPVALVHDVRLAFDTRGFAVWLIAKPDGWEIRAGALPHLLQDRTAPHGHIGRDKARRFLRELEQAGYLVRTRTQGANGRWIWRSVFTPTSTINALAVDGSPVDGCAIDGKGVDINHTVFTTDGFNSETNHLLHSTRQVGVGPTIEIAREIDIPPPLAGAYLTSARALISDCPLAQRQSVLDEVAAVHARGTLRGSPIGLLHRLIERAQKGKFVPSYAISYREKQRREAEERARLLERRTQGEAGEPVAASEIAQRALAQIRAKLKEPKP